ncbi:ABC transporter permease subunit [Marinomonas sp. THO17]|uniref:ABC transporter permease n=1 Tax=Marinomonas sp. THO17 TaxID=3149048 RepID=UPI00336BFE27
MSRPQFIGLHAKPRKLLSIFLAILPFVLVIGSYMYFSDIRLAENPNDKLLPSLSTMAETVNRMAFEEDRRTGDYLMVKDTLASLGRIAAGVGLATFVALILGLNMGLYRGMSAVLNPFVNFIAMIPPLSILPILLITFGVGELGKIMLIFIGTVLIMTRDIALYTRKIPIEMIIKGQTLGANPLAITYRIIMPQVMPRLLDSLRLSLGGAWLFLIAAEAIAASEGLGYRIFLSRRYMAMDVIIPYVFWITFLGFMFDYMLQRSVNYFYPWYSRYKT